MIKDVTKLLKEQEIKFEPNDIIVLYSDGITEAINKPKKDGSEEMFLEDRLVQSIENAPNIKEKDYKSSRSVFNNITIELSKFMGYNPVQLDDVTLATVHYK
jgi:serine phosphatase RsbU (regulator of sigma subunit)